MTLGAGSYVLKDFQFSKNFEEFVLHSKLYNMLTHWYAFHC